MYTHQPSRTFAATIGMPSVNVFDIRKKINNNASGNKKKKKNTS